MTCAYCGEKKGWPDGFPSTIYARCWDCTWEEHYRLCHTPDSSRLKAFLARSYNSLGLGFGLGVVSGYGIFLLVAWLVVR